MSRKEEIGDWVSNTRTVHGALFSELDVLLRALDRFFAPGNLPGSPEDVAVRNFYDELLTVRDAILRILGILEVLIPESKKNAYWFQKFAETKLFSDNKRDVFRQSLYRQDAPEKGLYMLYDSFNSLKAIISDLLRTGHVSYMGFSNLGNVIGKEIRENIYFNPFRKGLNPEYDFIVNHRISGMVKALRQRDVRKYASVIYLYLYRFLRYMRFIDIETQREVPLNSSLMILMLLKSEIDAFTDYIESAVKKVGDPDLAALLKTLSYQFAMEKKRVYLQELKDIYGRRGAPSFRGRIENSRGILKNLTEQSIVQLTRHFQSGIRGEDIFPSFTTTTMQSVRFREDLFVLHRLLTAVVDNAADQEARLKAFESLRNYMVYFEKSAFRLLRYDDYEGFESFFHRLKTLKGDTLSGPGFSGPAKGILHFKVFLETTLRHIANRAELRDRPVDIRKVKENAGKYNLKGAVHE
jgi:hypothetical protein